MHATLLALVIYGLQPPSVQGAADQPLREAGIVLRALADSGPMYVDEQSESAWSTDSTNTPAATSAASSQLLDALPNPAEFTAAQSALSELPSAPAVRPSPSVTGQVDQMTTGSAPSRGFNSKATVSVFGTSGTGTRFVYVFDRSISMAGTPLQAAKEQLIASLDSLDSIHQLQIIFFNHEPQSWDLTGGQNRIAFASDANKQRAEKFVRSVQATGGTFRHTALKLALRLRPDVIFFLTDTDDPMSRDDLAESIRRASRDGIAVNTIEYGIGRQTSSNNFLTQLARQTGGQYVYVDTQKLGR